MESKKQPADPLNKKFKAFTLKWYHPGLRHDLQFINASLEEEFLNNPLIQIIDYWFDYDDHIGIHINGVLKSSSYKCLYAQYSAKDTKTKGLYLHMQDIPSTKDYNKWLFYCYMRKEVNFKRFLPTQVDEDSSGSDKLVTF